MQTTKGSLTEDLCSGLHTLFQATIAGTVDPNKSRDAVKQANAVCRLKSETRKGAERFVRNGGNQSETLQPLKACMA